MEAVARLLTMSDTSAERQSSTPRYDFDKVDLESDNVHADIVRLVGEDARVLELGPATGYMSLSLVERGRSVVGIELDPAMAVHAAEVAARLIVGDLHRLDFDPELASDPFEVSV